MSLLSELRLWFSKSIRLNGRLSIDFNRSREQNVPVFRLTTKKRTENEDNLLSHIENNFSKCLPQFVTDVKVEEEEGIRHLYLIVDKNTFVNNTLKTYSKNIEERAKSLIIDESEKQKRLIFEYSSPNIAKPFHFGHLRSTVIGNCLSNVSSYLGHTVKRINYFGDWGTQFGILSLGFDDFGDEQQLNENALSHLYQIYVRANHECDRNEKYREKAKQRFFALENDSDPRVVKQWQRFKDESVKQYKETYDRLGVRFDVIESESMYKKASFEIVEKLEAMGLLALSDGAKVVRLRNGNDLDEVPLIKRDGSTLYLTRDIAAAIDRKQRFNFDRMYYVVDSAQISHFIHLKQILGQIGLDWQNDLFHLNFGRVVGLSTRKGTATFLHEIINEASRQALKYIKEAKTTKASEEMFNENADTLGISAVVVNDLKQRRKSDYHFDWNKVLRVEDKSGITLQYSHARLYSLQETFGKFNVDCDINLSALDSQEAFLLILSIANFEENLLKTYEQLEPSILVRYLFKLNNQIKSAYNRMKVMNEPESVAETRLLMFFTSRNALNQGMKLIGLKPLNAF